MLSERWYLSIVSGDLALQGWGGVSINAPAMTRVGVGINAPTLSGEFIPWPEWGTGEYLYPTLSWGRVGICTPTLSGEAMFLCQSVSALEGASSRLQYCSLHPDCQYVSYLQGSLGEFLSFLWNLLKALV